GRPNLIIIYSYFAYAIVAILVITDVINMIVYKTNKDGYLQYCHDKLKSSPEYGSKTDSDLNNSCDDLFRKYFIIIILITGLHFVISSYFAIIVAAYADTFRSHHDDDFSSRYYLTREQNHPYKI
ncbi:38478_t:CDS:2, partial [Gigaspora margarita]